MKKSLEYIDDCIEILAEALQKLRKIKEKATKELEEEATILNIVSKTSDDVAEIKRNVVG